MSFSETEAEPDLVSISEAEVGPDLLSISEAEAELDLLSISEAEAELDLQSVSMAGAELGEVRVFNGENCMRFLCVSFISPFYSITSFSRGTFSPLAFILG